MERIKYRINGLMALLLFIVCGLLLTRCDDLYTIRLGDHYTAVSTNLKNWQIELRSTPFVGHNFSITSIDEIQSTDSEILGYCESIAIPRIGMTPMWFILDSDSINERFFYNYQQFDSVRKHLEIHEELIPIYEYYQKTKP